MKAALEPVAVAGYRYLGITTDGSLHVYSAEDSWDIAVLGAFSNKWARSADPTLPRFSLEDDQLHDLDTNHTYFLAPIDG